MTSGMRSIAIAVVFVALTGCRFLGGKVKPDPTPAPPQPMPVEAKAPPAKLELPGPPPKIENKTPEMPTAVAVIPNPPAPRPKRRPAKKTVPATAGVTAVTTPVITPPVTPVAPAGTEASTTVPKLGEIHSDDQIVQLQKSCDESLTRAREALGQLTGLTLSAQQKQSLDRVRVFIAQAEQARPKDPQTAKQLAERADLLSRDLVRTVR